MYGSKHILSFDCADKTLGVCLLSYLPSDIINEHVSLIESERDSKQRLSQIAQLVTSILTVKSAWLFDLVPGLVVRDTEDAIRLSRLKYALKSIRKVLDDAHIKLDRIIIEYQMGQNDLSRLISPAIVYEFVDADSNIKINIGHLPTNEVRNGLTQHDDKKTIDVPSQNIVMIGPAFKNSFHFAKHLAYSTYASKYQTNKTANKHHTSENFKYFLALQSINNPRYAFNLKDKHSEINHVADAFMQAVYWIFNNEIV